LFRNAGTHYVKTSSAEVCDVVWRYTLLSLTASDEQINYQVLANKATLPGGGELQYDRIAMQTNYMYFYTLYEGVLWGFSCVWAIG
jgi:hypothetical protein